MEVDYRSYDHRSSEMGYPSPKNAIAMAKFVFKQLCQKKIKEFYLLGVDNSSTFLASFLIMECHKSKRKDKPTLIFASGNKEGNHVRTSDGFHPEAIPSVFVDDYYSLGRTLTYVEDQIRKWVPTGKRSDLYVFLIDSKKTAEVISEKYSSPKINCAVEILLPY